MDRPNAYYAGGTGVEMYDLFTGGGALTGDIAFYLDCAQRFGGPILELGTGTGRILTPLAEAGHHVVGLDLSPAMLAVAAGKLEANPQAARHARLCQGDVADFDLDQRFALILIPARSFQHLIDPADQRQALQCVRQHLVPGGHLVLDLFDPDLTVVSKTGPAALPPREILDPRTGHLVRRSVVARTSDPFRQTIMETLRFEVFDRMGGLIAQEETSWSLRWSMRQETAYLLELCSFEPVELFSDFKRSSPRSGAEQLWLARAV